MVKKIILSFLFLLPVLSAKADIAVDPFSQENVAYYNEVMEMIYQDIFAVKEDYKELIGFGPQSVTKNPHGVNSIHYQYKDPDGPTKGMPFEFGVTIVPENKLNFYSSNENEFNLGFPLLNVKFTGYQIFNARSKQFKVYDSVVKHGSLLYSQQAKYLPLRLTIETPKKEYKVGEQIDFKISLTNRSDHSIEVRELNENTLYFLYDQISWGAKNYVAAKVRKAELIRLKPGESTSKSFSGKSFSKPVTFQILAQYALTFEGFNPTNVIRVKVSE